MKTVIRKTARTAGEGISEITATRVILAACAVYFAFYVFMSFFMYQNLMYSDFDLAVHAQTLWNLVHGTGFSSILGVHFFANHFIPFFFLLRYVYAFWQSPLTLLVLQTAALASGIFFSYRLARRYVTPKWAMLLGLSYVFYPAIGFTNLFEFHPTTLAVPFLFLMIAEYADGRWVRFLLWSVVAMSFQENVPMAVFMMGALALYEKKGAKWVLSTVGLATVWFCLVIFLIQPFFNKGVIQFMRIYSYLGSSLPEIVLTLFTKPGTTLPIIFSPGSILYLLKLVSPFLFLPFLGLPKFLVLVPFILQHMLSSRAAAEQSLTYHYVTEMVPFLIWSSAAGLCWVLERLKQKVEHLLLMTAFVIAFVASSILLSPYLHSMDELEAFRNTPSLEYEKQLLSQIPKDTPVVATFRFLPKLSSRAAVYSFHHVYMGTYTLSDKQYVLPEVEYALLEMNTPYLYEPFETPMSPQNLAEFFKKPWVVVDSVQDTILLKKGKGDLKSLIETDPATSPKTPVEVQASDDLACDGFTLTMGEGAHQGHVRLVFFWHALKKIGRKYNMLITLVDPRGNTIYQYERPLGYRIYPPDAWASGEKVAESLWFVMPAQLPKETLELRVGVSDASRREFIPFTGRSKEKIDKDGRLKVEVFEPY